MAAAIPSYEDLFNEAKKQPVNFYWDFNTYKKVKENERYYVTNKIELLEGDVHIALIDFQTQEEVWLSCRDLLIDFMFYKEEKDTFFYYKPESTINIYLSEKVRTTKPYITKEEFLRHFKEMIGDRYIYFKFTTHIGTPTRIYNRYMIENYMDDDDFIKKHVKEYTIANIYKASKI